MSGPKRDFFSLTVQAHVHVHPHVPRSSARTRNPKRRAPKVKTQKSTACESARHGSWAKKYDTRPDIGNGGARGDTRRRRGDARRRGSLVDRANRSRAATPRALPSTPVHTHTHSASRGGTQELEAMKNKVKEMEDEAEKLRKIMGESEEQLGAAPRVTCGLPAPALVARSISLDVRRFCGGRRGGLARGGWPLNLRRQCPWHALAPHRRGPTLPLCRLTTPPRQRSCRSCLRAAAP